MSTETNIVFNNDPSGTKIKLNDGTFVPWIAFGTGTKLYKQDAAEAVKKGIDGGFTHLDGAQAYENEKSLGQGIKASGKPRSELYITTKLGPTKGSKVTVRDTLKKSLDELFGKPEGAEGGGFVDLFLIHQPSDHYNWKDIWEQMVGLLDPTNGPILTKSIGVSNFTKEQLIELVEYEESTRPGKGNQVIPVVNQIEFHPYLWNENKNPALNGSKDVYLYSKDNGIVTASYAGLGPLYKPGTAGGPLTKILPEIRARLQRDSESYKETVTEGQVLLKWLKQKGILIVTTTSGSNPKIDRVKEYLDTLELVDLNEDEIRAIDAAGEEKHLRFFGPNRTPVD